MGFLTLRHKSAHDSGVHALLLLFLRDLNDSHVRCGQPSTACRKIESHKKWEVFSCTFFFSAEQREKTLFTQYALREHLARHMWSPIDKLRIVAERSRI